MKASVSDPTQTQKQNPTAKMEHKKQKKSTSPGEMPKDKFDEIDAYLN